MIAKLLSRAFLNPVKLSAVLLFALAAAVAQAQVAPAPAPAETTFNSRLSEYFPELAPQSPKVTEIKPATAITQDTQASVKPKVATTPVQSPLPVIASDLWQRIRDGYGMPDLDNPLVAERQAYYLNHPETLIRAVERSKRYLYHIVVELEKRRMPTELALLPIVESAFNPLANSSAKASGLWQFIPSTGKNYNLEQNWWQDQRRDVIASTKAALDYLTKIHQMHGDWHLALASYNWGENAVARAVTKNAAAGLPTDYSSLSMPAETRNYVPKLQAIKNILSNPDLYGVRIPSIPSAPYFETVASTTSLDVTTAAKLADISVQEFIALNPGFSRPVIKSSNGEANGLVLPTEKVATFKANVLRYQTEDKVLNHWKTETVSKGESIDAIAKRNGISTAYLRRINGMARRASVHEGQNLLVPLEGANTDILTHLPNPVAQTTQTKADEREDAAEAAAKRCRMVKTKVGKGKRAKFVSKKVCPALTSEDNDFSAVDDNAAEKVAASPASTRASTCKTVKVMTGKGKNKKTVSKQVCQENKSASKQSTGKKSAKTKSGKAGQTAKTSSKKSSKKR